MGLEDKYQEHLLGVAEFLEANQARRFLTLANGSDNHRQKLFRMFYHDLKPKKAVSKLLDGADGFPGIIKAKLTKLGASKKAIKLSPSSDKEEIDLMIALEKTVGHDAGTIISCIPGKLAFWESDDMNYRYILHREGTN